MKTIENKDYIFFLSLMTAFALSLYFFEVLIPQPLPFMKVGLSNIVVLVLILSFFTKEAFIVALSKSVIGSFFTGTLISPSFVLSISGACFSCFIMVIAYRFLKNFSVFGLSVLGAFAHLLAQLVMVRLILIKTNSIFTLYPLIVFSAIITGLITGMLAFVFMKHINLRSVYVKISN